MTIGDNMKCKIDLEGTLWIEAESEIEAWGLNAWMRTNLADLPEDFPTPDIEIVYESKD